MSPRPTPTGRAQAGFTLLEILVVVMIIGLLTTFLATNLIGRGQEAQRDLVAAQIKQIEQQLEVYRLDSGRYPTQEQGLDALVREPSSSPKPRRYPPGGYVKPDQLRDAWDHPLQYRVPGQHNSHSFDLYSFGPDGAEGGEGSDADIGNWTNALTE